ncbi:MAG: ethylbenzene dehydrogenase-related protein [Desulfobacterales bacterium]
MSKTVIMSMMMSLAVVVAGMLFDAGEVTGAAKQTITAAKVKNAPGGLDDPVWQEAKAVQVPFEGKEQFAGKKASVGTKAVYTDDGIYFRFNWQDATKSVTKGAWQYDGQRWSHQKGNEDRIALLFEIERINKFATKGCAVVCHVPAGKTAKDGKFGTATAAEKGDMWHWKAARSDPAGFADDKWLTKIGEEKGGRKSDAGKGGDTKNMTADKSKPMYMPASGKQLAKNDILLVAHAVEIKDYSVFKSGDTVTFRMPNMPEGSRADIKALSRYADGSWTVMLYRKLDTGHDDDVAFNPRKKYNFAMALFDDSGDENSYDSEVLTLQFAR